MNEYPEDCYDSKAPAVLKILYGPDRPSTLTVWGNFIDYLIIGLSGKSFRALFHYWHSILENCEDTRYLRDGWILLREHDWGFRNSGGIAQQIVSTDKRRWTISSSIKWSDFIFWKQSSIQKIIKINKKKRKIAKNVFTWDKDRERWKTGRGSKKRCRRRSGTVAGCWKSPIIFSHILLWIIFSAKEKWYTKYGNLMVGHPTPCRLGQFFPIVRDVVDLNCYHIALFALFFFTQLQH